MTAASPASGAEPAAGSIRVVAQVPSKAYYVGQAIELRIGAEAGSERPEVLPPALANTDVALIGTTLSPVAAAGIGGQTSERNLFITRFRLIPHRAGVLRIPPVRVRIGTSSGSSPPLTVEVRSLPLSGRPAEFLGGVGEFTVEAEATPSTVRVGQEVLYTIRINGPAARGISSAPALARFEKTTLGLQVEPLSTMTTASPPSRSFRYRIRPQRAGSAALPPVAVAAFDPRTERYVTRVTSSIPIRAVEVARFDPEALNYVADSAPAPRARFVAPKPRVGVAILLVLFAIVLAAIAVRTVRKRWKINPRRLLLRRARRLNPHHEPEETARLITETLAQYFEQSSGRPRGVLTPHEARSLVAEQLRNPGLADNCARLIAACDRSRYSDHGGGSSELVDVARRLFEEIGRNQVRVDRSRTFETTERQP